MSLTAVTFDLWDTLVIDDSDEVERAARGLPTKAVARKALFCDAVSAAHPGLDTATISAAWDHLQDTFRHAWKVEHRTPHIADRLQVGLDHLGIGRPPGWARVIHQFSRMEVDIAPQPVPGIHAALDILAGRYRLGIVSDAIVTPGADLRDMMEKNGLKQYFESFVFSDEAGASKPDAKVFLKARSDLDAQFPQMAHVGDREYNDVGGPHGVGMKAVFYTAVVDRGSASTRAEAICSDPAQLPDLLAAL
ncbi:MAG: HAD family hydrolase [Alphaproteobacteria bacterium]|nr:HAD family hydrolase [Alphaproteobacteria bacterium]